MNNWTDLGRWWNLIFVVPFFIGALLVVLSVMGATDDGDASGDGDLDFDNSDADGDDGDDANEKAGAFRHIPPLMLAQNFLLFWGVLGWAANGIFARGEGAATSFVLLSIAIAACGGLVLTFALSSVLARWTPRGESSATSKRGLQGRVGEAVSIVSETSGSVYARDEGGTLHQLPARVWPGTKPLPRGAQVLVIEYQEKDDCYLVKSWTPD